MKLTNAVRSLGMSTMLVAAGLVLPSAVEKAVSELGYSVTLGSAAMAQEDTRQPRRLPGLALKFTEDMAKVEEFINPPDPEDGKPAAKQDLPAAEKLLNSMEKKCKDKCNGYEMANIYNFMAYLAYEREDMKKTAFYYEKVVEQAPEIPWGLEEQTLLYLAKLYAGEENYKKAIHYMDRYMNTVVSPNADAFYTKSTICYQMSDYDCSLKNVNTAVEMIEKAGFVAKEQWYNLQRGINNEREDYKQSLKSNIKLVKNYPKKSYWNDMASFYSLLEDNSKALAVMDAGFIGGTFTKEKQYLQLAQFLYQADAPYNAAMVIHKGMKANAIEQTEANLEKAGRYFLLAKEYKMAIDYLTRAGDKSDKGDIYSDVVGIYLAVEDLKGAIAMGKKALDKKGGLKKPGRLHYNMGSAYFEMKQFDAALKSLQKATEDRETKRLAEQWIKYVENEKDRYERLAEFYDK